MLEVLAECKVKEGWLALTVARTQGQRDLALVWVCFCDMYGAFGKYSDLLHFFHIVTLQPYSKVEKNSITLHTLTHNVEATTVFFSRYVT